MTTSTALVHGMTRVAPGGRSIPPAASGQAGVNVTRRLPSRFLMPEPYRRPYEAPPGFHTRVWSRHPQIPGADHGLMLTGSDAASLFPRRPRIASHQRLQQHLSRRRRPPQHRLNRISGSLPQAGGYPEHRRLRRRLTRPHQDLRQAHRRGSTSWCRRGKSTAPGLTAEEWATMKGGTPGAHAVDRVLGAFSPTTRAEIMSHRLVIENPPGYPATSRARRTAADRGEDAD